MNRMMKLLDALLLSLTVCVPVSSPADSQVGTPTNTITFNRRGGSGGTDSVTATFGAPMPDITLPTRKGYVFQGYFNESDGDDMYYTADGSSARDWDGAQDTTLFAQWRPTKYTVAFVRNGGKGTMKNQTFLYGEAQKLRKNQFRRTGYKFKGWAKTSSGAVAFKNGQSVKNLDPNGQTVMLYARWAAKKYKVKFCHTYSNEKGKMKVQTMTYDRTKRLLKNKFKRSGYMFKGWAKSKAKAKKGKAAYKDKRKVKNLTKTGKTVKLYAVWKKK